MPGRFIKSEWTSPNGSVFEMQHRYEDRALILDVIRQHRPTWAIELGTAKGGFAALLAETVREWQGWVITADKDLAAPVKSALYGAYDRPDFHLVALNQDVLTEDPTLTWWKLNLWDGKDLPVRRTLLYCDNGNKPREIERFAPMLRPGDLLGCHDYWTEVDPTWVEPFLADLGYVPHRHAEFAALADPVNYPASLTRFWTRA